MEMKLTIPDDLALRLQPVWEHLPRILELGLRELDAQALVSARLGEVLDALAHLSSAEKVLALRPSPALQSRVEELLAKNRTTGTSEDER
jgi:hypothetical protein